MNTSIAHSARAAVSASTTVAVIFNALIRGIARRGRLLLLVGGTVAFIGAAWLIGRNATLPADTAFVNLSDDVLLRFLTPLLALIACSSGLPEANNDGTLVYLWLRPIGRWWMALGGWLASFAVIAPFTVIATVGSAVVMQASATMTATAAASALVACAAYTSTFTLLGMLTRAGTMIALGYMLIWEGALARIGKIGRYSSIERYSVAIVANRLPDTQLRYIDSYPFPGTALSVVVLLAVTAVMLALTGWRIAKMTVA